MTTEDKTRMTPTAVLTVQKFMHDKVEQTEFEGKPACRYVKGWNDAKVGIATGIGTNVIRRVRLDLYGPIAHLVVNGRKRRRVPGANRDDGSSLNALHLTLSRLVSGEITRIIDLNASQAKRQNGAVIELRVALRRIETEVASVKALLAQGRMQCAGVPNAKMMLLSEDRAQVHVQPALHADPADGKGPLI